MKRLRGMIEGSNASELILQLFSQDGVVAVIPFWSSFVYWSSCSVFCERHGPRPRRLKPKRPDVSLNTFEKSSKECTLIVPHQGFCQPLGRSPGKVSSLLSIRGAGLFSMPTLFYFSRSFYGQHFSKISISVPKPFDRRREGLLRNRLCSDVVQPGIRSSTYCKYRVTIDS